MIRKMIEIDETLCNGCGVCAAACHEGAIAMVDGKAKLLRDDYCDGLGDCLPVCPTNAITITQREAAPYDKAAVAAKKAAAPDILPCGCPGSHVKTIARTPQLEWTGERPPSALTQWPVQIKLAPVRAPYFAGCRLLIAADCAAFAYGDFHRQFIQGRTVLVGCPKLDAVDYTEKLTEILRENNIMDVTVVRMEVPCCAGLAHAAKAALENSGKVLPLQVVTIGVDGAIRA